jgi:hypothetical protein
MLIKVKPLFYVALFDDPFDMQFNSFQVLNFFCYFRMRYPVVLSEKAATAADPHIPSNASSMPHI